MITAKQFRKRYAKDERPAPTLQMHRALTPGNEIMYIGIDPAFRADGFGVCVINPNNEKQTVHFLKMKSFLDFVFWITGENIPDGRVVVCVENSNLQNSNFDNSGGVRAAQRKGRDVGKNQAISQCTVDLCRWRFGFKNVIEVSPRQKGAKWTHAKYESVRVASKHLPVPRQSNQDDRDAYALAMIAKKRI